VPDLASGQWFPVLARLEGAVTNPYLEPVAAVWSRIAGVALLAAAAGLSVVLVYQLFDLLAHPEHRRALTSSSVIFALILLVLCGICWQAGLRLVSGRPDRSAALFSGPAWFAIGAGLIVVTALMAAAVIAARRPNLLDIQVTLFLAGIGVWCVVLAWRTGRGGPGDGKD
jgi:hypothetical protein